ncbi:SCO6745 family protein [Streptomyces europaeiscabiei]|uniref:SCO6745 family protein n=1 Tax=Streptomyces europaeiscabiei TaxID=146819 RepID=UPI0038F7590A
MSVPTVTPRTTARAPHDVIEPRHAVLYHAPHVRESFLVVGLKATWRGCFGGRASALDPAPAAVVTTLFPLPHSKPSPVARAVTSVWEAALPDAVLAARSAGVDAALRALLGDTVDGPELAEDAPLAAAAAAACDAPGCALGAGMAFLALPQASHLALWQAVTALCEHRGDGQVGVRAHAELDGIEALVRITAAGSAVRESTRARQGWTDEEWAEGERRLRDRGMLDSARGLTPGDRAARAAVEALTDLFASAPWKALGARNAHTPLGG